MVDTEWDKSRFKAVEYTKNSLFLYHCLLIIVLFSIWTAVNLRLLHPVFTYNILKEKHLKVVCDEDVKKNK